MSRLFILVCSVLIAAVTLCSASLPVRAETGDANFERIMKKQYDWILYCDLDVLPDYLKYKNSPLNPIDRFTVTYLVPPSGLAWRNQKNTSTDPVKYEELWYHNGRAVGMKRFSDLPLRKDMQGAIYFRSSLDSGVCDHTLSCANVAIRLLLDVYIKRSILAAVIVPQSCFEQVSSDLGQFNFFLLEAAFGGRGENMSLHLVSYPRGTERYFYYDDEGRR